MEDSIDKLVSWSNPIGTPASNAQGVTRHTMLSKRD